MFLKLSFAALIAVALICPVADARSQEKRSEEELKNLTKQGLARARAGHMDEAITIWEDVLTEAVGELTQNVHFNLAAAYEQVGKVPEAWHHLGAFIRGTDKDDPEASEELLRFEKLLSEEHVKLAVTCSPDDATVHLGDSPASTGYACPLTWWFKAGTQLAHVVRDGYHSKTEEFQVLKVGGEAIHAVTLEKKEEVAPPVIVEKPDAPPDGGTDKPDVGVPGDGPGIEKGPVETGKGARIAQWVLVGGGGTMIVVGAILNGVASSKEKDLFQQYPDERFQEQYDAGYADDVKPKTTAAYVFYGLGAATAAGGLVWLLVDHFKNKGAGTSAVVTPVVSSGQLGFTLGIEF